MTNLTHLVIITTRRCSARKRLGSVVLSLRNRGSGAEFVGILCRPSTLAMTVVTYF